jgi:hypothetical protein
MTYESSKVPKCRSIVFKPGEFRKKSAQKFKITAKKTIFAFLTKISPLLTSKISDPGI